METRASTRLLAVLGDPVAHSLSPDIQNAGIRALGLDAVYVALRVPAAALTNVLTGLAAAGGAGNVTVPHKAAAEGCVARKTDVCARSGACNTFWMENGVLVGDNTDVAGIGAALAGLGAERGGRWLLLGTGGTARAVAVVAAARGAELVVGSRTLARATEFAAWAAAVGCRARARKDGDRSDVAINTTPLGLRPGDALPLDPKQYPGIAAALDLVYAPGETPWTRAMRAAGARAADGRGARVAQGAAAFERFFPGTRAPLEVMRAAVARALGA